MGTTEGAEEGGEEVKTVRLVCPRGVRTKKPSTGAGTSSRPTTNSIVKAAPWVGLGRIIVAGSKRPPVE
jgi:hypothetical protein